MSAWACNEVRKLNSRLNKNSLLKPKQYALSNQKLGDAPKSNTYIGYVDLENKWHSTQHCKSAIFQ